MNLRQLKRVLLQTLLLPIVAAILVAGALAWQLWNAQKAVQAIEQIDANIAIATTLSALVSDENAGVRSYQITGNEIFLQPYAFARAPLATGLTQLEQGLAGQPEPLQQLAAFRSIHARWVATTAGPLIAAVATGQQTSSSGLNLRAKAQSDVMSQLLNRVVAEQRTRRLEAAGNWEIELRRTVIDLIGSVLVGGLLFGVFARSRLHLVSATFQAALRSLQQHTAATDESERRLRTILTSLADAVVVCDLAGCILSMNPAAEHLAACSEAAARKQPFEAVFPLRPADGSKPPPSAKQILEGGEHAQHPATSLVLARADGAEILIDQNTAPLQEETGTAKGIVLVLRDVTQQRRTQSALLASEKLATAGRLAATIAHEMHNPLDSVSNLLYLIQTGDSAEENAEFVALARTELDRATQISRSLLGMYRESRTAVALDLAELIESVLLLLQRRFIQANVTLKLQLDKPSMVTGFPVELRQVFTNLLANAADAAPSGSTVTLRTEIVNGTQQTGVIATLHDQGPGIPAEIQQRLFQPFFSTKGESGTGLGLWVSKGIVLRHEGTIDLQSTCEGPSHGTTITVFLPCSSYAPAISDLPTQDGEIILPEHVRTAPERGAA